MTIGTDTSTIVGAVLRSSLYQSDPVLGSYVSTAITNHIRPKTRSSYETATRDYLRFCEERNQTPFPVGAVTLSAWLIKLSSRIQVQSMGV